MRMVRELVSAASLYLIGALMEISTHYINLDIRYYLYVLFGTSVLALLLHVIRRIM